MKTNHSDKLAEPAAEHFAIPPKRCLIATLMTELFDQIKPRYITRPAKFNTEIDSYAQRALTAVRPAVLQHAIGQLIVDAFESVQSEVRGLVKVRVTADVEFIEISVHDNGGGLTTSMIEKMTQSAHSDDKNTVWSIRAGLQKIRSVSSSIPGTLSAEFTPGVGTRVILTLSRADVPD